MSSEIEQQQQPQEGHIDSTASQPDSSSSYNNQQPTLSTTTANPSPPSSSPSSPREEDLTSPIITSPPYWHQSHSSNPQSTTRHNRGFSTSSVEFVLPPGAITLRDNEDDDDTESNGGQSQARYSRDRNRACWARSVNVVDYVLVNGSATNLGAFVVWNIKVETLTGSKINIRKRYSEFDDLRKKLVQTFPNFEAAVPSLPPKSVLNKFKPKFLEKRRGGLQYFLNCILLNPEFSGSPVLKEFLFS